METFIVYQHATAAIIFRGSGPIGTADIQQPPEGCSAIALTQSSFLNGLPLEIEPLRADIWEAVKVQREKAIAGGATTPSGVVDSDQTSLANISGAALAALISKMSNSAYSITWTLQNNQPVSLDADEMIAVGLAVMAHVDAAHERARALRDMIESAPDIEALLSIEIGADWPGETVNG